MVKWGTYISALKQKRQQRYYGWSYKIQGYCVSTVSPLRNRQNKLIWRWYATFAMYNCRVCGEKEHLYSMHCKPPFSNRKLVPLIKTPSEVSNVRGISCRICQIQSLNPVMVIEVSDERKLCFNILSQTGGARAPCCAHYTAIRDQPFNINAPAKHTETGQSGLMPL